MAVEQYDNLEQTSDELSSLNSASSVNKAHLLASMVTSSSSSSNQQFFSSAKTKTELLRGSSDKQKTNSSLNRYFNISAGSSSISANNQSTNLKTYVYIFSSLLILQLIFTSLGFYLLFNYTKSQNESIETRLSGLLTKILDQSIDDGGAEPENEDGYMILNLTHPIKMDPETLSFLTNSKETAINGSEFDETDQDLTVLDKKVKIRLRRNIFTPQSSATPPFTPVSHNHHRNRHIKNSETLIKLNKTLQNQFNNLNHQNKKKTEDVKIGLGPNGNDHFFIQAYSKISVKALEQTAD